MEPSTTRSLSIVLSTLALILSVIAVVTSLGTRGRVDEKVRGELARREEAIVADLLPRVNTMRADFGLPSINATSLRETLNGAVEVFQGISGTPATTPSD